MPQVSKRKPLKDIEEMLFETLLRILNAPQNKTQTLQLVHSLLTKTETIMLSKRIAIALMLKQRNNYEQIKTILKVSQGTVAKIKDLLDEPQNNYFMMLLDQIIMAKKRDATMSKLDELLEKLTPLPKGGNWQKIGKEMFQRTKARQRKKSLPI